MFKMFQKTAKFVAVSFLCSSSALAAPPFTGPVEANVVNTPDVNVVNLPDVNIVNAPAYPVPTRPGGQPVQAQIAESCGTSQCSGTLYTVPEGKLLIIEHIGVRTDTPDPDDRFSVKVITTLDGAGVFHELGMLEKHPGLTGNAQHQGGFRTSLYAGPGTPVLVVVNLGESFASISFLVADLSGRLVDY